MLFTFTATRAGDGLLLPPLTSLPGAWGGTAKMGSLRSGRPNDESPSPCANRRPIAIVPNSSSKKLGKSGTGALVEMSVNQSTSTVDDGTPTRVAVNPF